MIDNWDAFQPITNSVCQRVVLTLLHFLWQGLLLGGLACCVSWFCQKWASASRYLLQTVLLFCMPLCLVVTWNYLEIPATELSTGLLGAQAPMADDDLIAFPNALPVDASAVLHSDNVAGAEELDTIAAKSSEVSREAEASLLSTVSLPICCAYLLGAGYFLIRFAVALWGGHRLRSEATPIVKESVRQLIDAQAKRLRLRFVPVVAYCERVAVPTVIGAWRPMVLLPSVMMGIELQHLESILSHEFAHIRRGDLFVNLAQRIVESILFFHPAVWYVSRRVSYERELCCDDVAVDAAGQRMRYAGALLEMAELCAEKNARTVALAVTGDNQFDLEKRIYRLMSGRNAQPRIRLSRIGTAALVAGFVLLAASPGIYQGMVSAAPAEEVEKNSEQTEPAGSDSDLEEEKDNSVRTAIAVVNDTFKGRQRSDSYRGTVLRGARPMGAGERR